MSRTVATTINPHAELFDLVQSSSPLISSACVVFLMSPDVSYPAVRSKRLPICASGRRRNAICLQYCRLKQNRYALKGKALIPLSELNWTETAQGREEIPYKPPGYHLDFSMAIRREQVQK